MGYIISSRIGARVKWEDHPCSGQEDSAKVRQVVWKEPEVKLAHAIRGYGCRNVGTWEPGEAAETDNTLIVSPP